jgi:Fe-S-cluster-containing dehydrogenase component/mono/diheme cytochrome c family protein
MARLAMLIDLTRCIGCDTCTLACKQENGTPVDVFFARVLNVEAGTYPKVQRIYIPVLCNHCDNPACLKACPNKAIFRRPDGIVLIDQDRCRGAGACVSACPYGNIILTERDRWYLPDNRAYERDYVRPRLKERVARKCAFCAHRVDEGLEPACVVACPTTARIFGDLEDPNSKISRYIAEQRETTGREPFHLLPEAQTQPANMYLGTMASQSVSALDESGSVAATRTVPASLRESREPAGVLSGRAFLLAKITVLGLLAIVLLLALRAYGQQNATAPTPADLFADASCAGCHGANAMGGLGPPLAETRLSLQEFRRIVREGRGMMPATPASEMPDTEVEQVYEFVRHTKLDLSQVPISYKVGQWLSTARVTLLFSLVALVWLVLTVRAILYWLDCAGWKQLKPYLRRFGYGRAAAVFLRSLVVDGLLVSHLWQRDRFRWVMHALLLYGFLALGLADILMDIFNPTRGTLPITHPLKLLPNIAGLLVLAGAAYVRYRYSEDPYIDNGLTLSRDYTFLTLLTWTIVTGFLLEGLGYAGAYVWVQPVYLLHLALVAALFLTAPFTRFQHAFLVPILMAITRVTSAVAYSGVERGFMYEPSPGRHHKSERIAADVLQKVAPELAAQFRLRYFP